MTGTNEWRNFDSWPPTNGIKPRRVYFGAGGRLSFDVPVDRDPKQYDEYVSDPANPVPFVPRPIQPVHEGTGWGAWQAVDQSFLHGRADVLVWRTEVLDHDIVIAGNVVADLYASTSGSDSDWIVKLIDVHPAKGEVSAVAGGYELMVAGEIVRGRFRKSLEHPERIPPGRVCHYQIDMHSHAHAFLKGHRIMIQVQSTWFPVIDRNPQKFVENIFDAKEDDFSKATQRIVRSAEGPSSVLLPIYFSRNTKTGGR